MSRRSSSMEKTSAYKSRRVRAASLHYHNNNSPMLTPKRSLTISTTSEEEEDLFNRPTVPSEHPLRPVLFEKRQSAAELMLQKLKQKLHSSSSSSSNHQPKSMNRQSTVPECRPPRIGLQHRGSLIPPSMTAGGGNRRESLVAPRACSHPRNMLGRSSTDPPSPAWDAQLVDEFSSMSRGSVIGSLVIVPPTCAHRRAAARRSIQDPSLSSSIGSSFDSDYQTATPSSDPADTDVTATAMANWRAYGQQQQRACRHSDALTSPDEEEDNTMRREGEEYDEDEMDDEDAILEVQKQIYRAKSEAKTVSVVNGCLYINYQYVCPLPPGCVV